MRSAGTRPKCDTGKGPVTVDWILAGAAGLGALAALESDAVGPGLAVGVAAGAFAASALRGNNAVNECRDAIAAYEGSDGPERLAIDDDEDEPQPPPRIIVPPQTPGDPYAQPHASPARGTPPTAAPASPAMVAPPRVAPPPAVAPSTPTVVAPATKPKPTKPTRPAAAAQDDWDDFWQEVP